MSLAALAAWAAAARLPSGVLRRAGLVLADDLAAMLAFRDVPELRRLRDRLAPTARGEAMVVGTGRRAARRDAALLNAAAACWGEMDGGHAPSRSHPNLMVIPALLAEAEVQAASVRTALAALAVGYEVAARMGMHFPAHPILVHPHAQFAAIGAAAAVGRLRRFRAARFREALAMAASMALAGPFTHAQQGATVRNAWAGLGAGLGFAACDLAEAGFSGAEDAPGAVFAGLFAGHDGSPALARGLGERWAIDDAYQKFTSACHYAHAAVEAAVAARSALGGPPDAVEEVLVETFPLALTLGNQQPSSPLAARFSVPHAVAAALVFGDCGPARCEAPDLNDKRVVAMRARVRLAPIAEIAPPPHDRPSRVTVRVGDGRRFSALCQGARGSPAAPATIGQVLAKGAALAGRAFPRFAAFAASLAAGERAVLDAPLSQALRTALKERPK